MDMKKILALIGVLIFGAGIALAMTPAASVSALDLQRWIGNATASADVTEGGNVTYLNISGASLTDKWAAYYGNVTGSIVLKADNDSASVNVYTWAWPNTTVNGSVCASPGNAFNFDGALVATGANVDTAYAYNAADADTGAKTFTGNCSFTFARANVTDTGMADTGGSPYQTCVVRDDAVTTTEDDVNLAYCTKLAAGTNYKLDSVMYEMIVPTGQGGAGVTESYYFYIELR